MHAKEIEKSVEWKRSDMKSAKESVKMDVPSMFDVVSVCRCDIFGKLNKKKQKNCKIKIVKYGM